MGNDIVKPSRMLKSVLFVALLVALASQSSGIPEDTFVPETTFREDDADRAYPDTEGASEATEVQESAQHIFKHIAKHFDAAKKHISKIVNDAAKHSGLQNAGKDCWEGCRTKQGQCSWCGTGSCCRMGWKGNGCDGTMGILGKGHVCVAGHAKKHAKKDDGRRRRRKAEKKEQDMKEKAAKKDAAKKKHFDECRKNEEKCHAKYADLKKKHADYEAKAYHHHTKSKARIHWTELWKWWLHTERAKHAAMAKEHAGIAAKLKAEVKKRDKHCVDALIKCLKEDDEEEDDDDEEEDEDEDEKHPKHPHYKPHYKRL